MVNTMPLPPAPPEILLVPIDEQDRKAGVRRKDGELHGRNDGHEGDNAPPPMEQEDGEVQWTLPSPRALPQAMRRVVVPKLDRRCQRWRNDMGIWMHAGNDSYLITLRASARLIPCALVGSTSIDIVIGGVQAHYISEGGGMRRSRFARRCTLVKLKLLVRCATVQDTL